MVTVAGSDESLKKQFPFSQKSFDELFLHQQLKLEVLLDLVELSVSVQHLLQVVRSKETSGQTDFELVENLVAGNWDILAEDGRALGALGLEEQNFRAQHFSICVGKQNSYDW